MSSAGRARVAVRGDLMRARQRLSKLLLRHDVIYEDTASAWTIRHRSWLTSLDLGQRGAQVTCWSISARSTRS
jgi:transposase